MDTLAIILFAAVAVILIATIAETIENRYQINKLKRDHDQLRRDHDQLRCEYDYALTVRARKRQARVDRENADCRDSCGPVGRWYQWSIETAGAAVVWEVADENGDTVDRGAVTVTVAGRSDALSEVRVAIRNALHAIALAEEIPVLEINGAWQLPARLVGS